MVGNDIVDRARAKQDSNWQRRGFLDKLFSPGEQQLIRAATDPECLVWLLWSLKESAYKATARQTGKRTFNPAKINCTLQSWSGAVVAGSVVYEIPYQTRSLITPDYIASIAFPASLSAPPEQAILLLDKTDHQSQSTQLRTRIIQKYASLNSVLTANVQLEKEQYGGPVLVIRTIPEQPVYLPISISHHGQYGAYCLAPADFSFSTAP